MADEVDGALLGTGPYGGQDHVPEQKVQRQAGQLRLGGRVLQLQGVGGASAYSACYKWVARADVSIGLLHTPLQGGRDSLRTRDCEGSIFMFTGSKDASR